MDAPEPTFLAAHPRLPLVYAVHERPDGGLGVYDRELEPVAILPSGGNGPCHLAVDPSGRWVAVAHYGDGSVAVHDLGADGVPTGVRVLAGEGGGPHPNQDGPHAHQCVFGDDGVLYVTDLGSDEIRRYRLGEEIQTLDPVRLKPGGGPRHMTTDGRHWYVANELDATVSVHDRAWTELSRTPASGFSGLNYPSHIELSADGRHLYIANRGPDTIGVFAVGDGRVTPVAEVSSGGAWPRHFALAGGRVYVACQRAGHVAVFSLAGGLPEPTGETIAHPGAACVLPVTPAEHEDG
ncbi:lactonase family protein [Bailinhaonella thermotolerans]|uniref:lactonase family protein n=1 Tax=Bailinhaonella thermotolerans TaxID=1070861 RepID=UPI00192A4006|nr:lactonase family protein [Bailinhaonella thermotolerans]